MKYVSRAFFIIAIGHLFLLIGCKNETTNISIPYISSFSPIKGRIDTIVTLTGRNFSRARTGNIVNINGFTCPIISASESQIVIKAVPGVSSGIVSVTVQDLSSIALNSFELNPQVIQSFEPDTAVVGEKINFTGLFFSDTADSVRLWFNNTEAPIADYTVTNEVATFSAVVPADAFTGPITVGIAKVKVDSEKNLVIKD